MSRYRIVSEGGVDMGIWEADTAQDALDAMARAAGYRDDAHAHESVPDCGAATATEIEDDASHVTTIPSGHVIDGQGPCGRAEIVDARGSEHVHYDSRCPRCAEEIEDQFRPRSAAESMVRGLPLDESYRVMIGYSGGEQPCCEAARG